jgi:hypothetical protein
VRNEIETKRNQRKRNEAKLNQRNQNEQLWIIGDHKNKDYTPVKEYIQNNDSET